MKPVFSVIIPTFQRRDLVAGTVLALSRQNFPRPFEVIVVVDGSTDGTADALRTLDLPFPLKVIEQANFGRAAAINRGVESADGRYLLFLDDDMEADPSLLAVHQRSLAAGADGVLGHVPVHPDTPKSFLSAQTGAWSDNRLQRLSMPHATLELGDLLTGQFSLPRTVFRSVGGFDEAFTNRGIYGGEDNDLGLRLLATGRRIVFNREAISYHKYQVTPRQFLRRTMESAAAEVALARKHPSVVPALLQSQEARPSLHLFVLRPIARLPVIGRLATTLAAELACLAVDLRPNSAWSRRLHSGARELAYWRGQKMAGDLPSVRAVRVLAYHSISQRKGQRRFGEYVIPPRRLARQLRWLRLLGFQFLKAQDALAGLRGEIDLPKRAVVLTFDDGYSDFASEALPVLSRWRAPATLFVVTGLLGQTNAWDKGEEDEPRTLLSRNELEALPSDLIQLGSHSRTHPLLPSLSDSDAIEEIEKSMQDLRSFAGSRLFCYPFGESSPAVEERVRAAGVHAAFSVMPGKARPGSNLMRIPRIQILERDGAGVAFVWKVLAANH